MILAFIGGALTFVLLRTLFRIRRAQQVEEQKRLDRSWGQATRGDS